MRPEQRNALTEHLVAASIEPWNIFVGGERLSSCLATEQ